MFDRSSLTRWRQRMGEDKLTTLLQESLAVAVRTDALKPSELSRVIVDTTVQPKNVMFPPDARLLHRAREILVRMAAKHGVRLRQIEALVGNTIERILADAGYRGHNAPPEYMFRVYTAGQKRRMTPQIKRQMRRRSAVEPVIGHLKAEHRMGRNYLARRAGDATDAVLAAAGYNFSLLIRWLRLLLLQILSAIVGAAIPKPA